MTSISAEPNFFLSLERRYHILHILGVALAAAATIAAFLLWFAPRPAWGPDLSLTGKVPEKMVLTLTTAGYDNANISLDQNVTRTALSVADVYEQSNKGGGYTVTVTSANQTAGGRCPLTTTTPCFWNVLADRAENVSFDVIKLGTGTLTWGTTGNWTDTTAKNKTGTTTQAQLAFATGTELRTDGDYIETLTFTIAAK